MKEQKGFFMPAEWVRHEGTLLAWPVKESMVWPENYEEVCHGFANVVKAIAGFEPVTVIVNETDVTYTDTLCSGMAKLMVIPHNDAWIRDNGPTFLLNEHKERSAICWKFNAWGEKYKPYDLDSQVAVKILHEMKLNGILSPLVLEGGSIHVDGEGTLLTTEECLLNKNRNPHLSRDEISMTLKDKLQVSTILWLKCGLYGDETDGHVDNIACFAKPGTILIQTCEDPSDPNYEITKENLKILRSETDGKGRNLEIIQLPQPPIRYYNGKRLTLSYLNFYFVNGGIILPIFGGDASETDQQAIECLKRVFDDRKIVTVDGIPIVKEGGNVHCITQQIPEGHMVKGVKDEKKSKSCSNTDELHL